MKVSPENVTDLQRISCIYDACRMLGAKYESTAARQMLAAIAYQESNFYHRQQIGGPARGFWQFEKNGGVRGVLTHPSTATEARRICEAGLILPTPDMVYATIATDDILAAAFARLLLWSDPRPLPTAGAEAWEYYLRNWRPGKPHPERWAACWQKAKDLLS